MLVCYPEWTVCQSETALATTNQVRCSASAGMSGGYAALRTQSDARKERWPSFPSAMRPSGRRSHDDGLAAWRRWTMWSECMTWSRRTAVKRCEGGCSQCYGDGIAWWMLERAWCSRTFFHRPVALVKPRSSHRNPASKGEGR
jgi:hypothetical protein